MADSSSYIGQLDKLNEFLRKIYYELDDTIKAQTPSPTFEKYREELDIRCAFLPFILKDFPEHHILVNTIKSDIKIFLDNLADDKTFRKAASATFNAGQSIQALAAALIYTNDTQGNTIRREAGMTSLEFRTKIANKVEDLLTEYPDARVLFTGQMKRYEELWQAYLSKAFEEPQPDEDPLAIPKNPPKTPEYLKSNNREKWLKYLKDRNALEKFKEVKENLSKYLDAEGEYSDKDFEYDGHIWYPTNTEPLPPDPGKLCDWGRLNESDRLCCYYGILARLYDLERPNAPYQLCPDSLEKILNQYDYTGYRKSLHPDYHDTFNTAIQFVRADIDSTNQNRDSVLHWKIPKIKNMIIGEIKKEMGHVNTLAKAVDNVLKRFPKLEYTSVRAIRAEYTRRTKLKKR